MKHICVIVLNAQSSFDGVSKTLVALMVRYSTSKTMQYRIKKALKLFENKPKRIFSVQ